MDQLVLGGDCAGGENPLMQLAKRLSDGPGALPQHAPGPLSMRMLPSAPAAFVDGARLQRDMRGLRFGDTGARPDVNLDLAVLRGEYARAHDARLQEAAAHELAFARAQQQQLQQQQTLTLQSEHHVWHDAAPVPTAVFERANARMLARPLRFARTEWRHAEEADSLPVSVVSPQQLLHPTAWAEAFLAADAEPSVATAAEPAVVSKPGPSADALELARAAKALLQQTTDPKLKGSKFMEFVQQLGDGELELEGNTLLRKAPAEVAAEWARQFKQAEQAEQLRDQLPDVPADVPLNADDWARRFGAGNWGRFGLDDDGGWEELAAALGGMGAEGNQAFGDAWHGESAFSPAGDTAMNEASSSALRMEGYAVEKDNPFVGGGEAFDVCMRHGRDAQQQGALGHAILWFEAAVQNDAARTDAWQALGECQMENEQDPSAIAALRQCVQLDGANCPAFLSLATCLTNEMEYGEAYAALEAAVTRNPAYSAAAAADPMPAVDPMLGGNRLFAVEKLHARVLEVYMRAVAAAPDAVDADVQVGLGILFNISREYDKAVDCFGAALAVRPDDSRTWNKLGATLANSERSAEAIAAYRKALELQPGFIRARYNLGAGCINLQAYHEAAEHLLTALSMQQAHTASASQKNMSNSIWLPCFGADS